MKITLRPTCRLLASATIGTLFATVGSVAVGATSGQVDLRQQTPIHGDAQIGASKVQVCAACHGQKGIAPVAQFPNLAGQSATYLYVQMRAFKDGWRHDATMQAMMTPLDDQDLRHIAAFYATQAPAPPHANLDAADSRGRALYLRGDPARGIPGCQGCHGADGHGPQPNPASPAPQPAWTTFPALAGQQPAYVVKQLQAYRDGTRDGSSNTRIMHAVSANLDAADMQAVADHIAAMTP